MKSIANILTSENLIKRGIILLYILIFSIIQPSKAQWVSLPSGTIDLITSISFPTADTGYFVQSSGEIRKTLNGGQSWSFLNFPNYFSDIAFSTADVGYACADSGIYKTVDGGSNWSMVFNDDNGYYDRIYVFDSLIIVFGTSSVVYDSVMVVRSGDYGATWHEEAVFTDGFSPLTGLSMISVDTIYATGWSGIVQQSFDHGFTWSTLCQVPPNGFENLCYISANTGFLLTTIILKTTDGSNSFYQVNTNGNNTAFYDMVFVTDSIGYVVGGNGISSGVVLKTYNQGDIWQIDTSSVQTFYCLAKSPNAVYAGGTGGILLKTDLNTGIAPEELLNSDLKLHLKSDGTGILEGTQKNGWINTFDSRGRLINSIITSEKITPINLPEPTPGIYYLQYLNGQYCKSFKAILTY